jgi:hypothetical protein
VELSAILYPPVSLFVVFCFGCSTMTAREQESADFTDCPALNRNLQSVNAFIRRFAAQGAGFGEKAAAR